MTKPTEKRPDHDAEKDSANYSLTICRTYAHERLSSTSHEKLHSDDKDTMPPLSQPTQLPCQLPYTKTMPVISSSLTSASTRAIKVNAKNESPPMTMATPSQLEEAEMISKTNLSLSPPEVGEKLVLKGSLPERLQRGISCKILFCTPEEIN